MVGEEKTDEKIAEMLQFEEYLFIAKMEGCESPHQLDCEICMEKKPAGEMFTNETCSHRCYCRDCIGKHIAAKVEDNVYKVKCPMLICKGVLEPSCCRSLVPEQVFDRWVNLHSEPSVTPERRWIPCPFKDCAKMLEVAQGTDIKCKHCQRSLCSVCGLQWHSGHGCEEFQRLSHEEKDDLMMKELAKNKGWGECPGCGIFVERVEGCLRITCRCNIEFCYKCRCKWTETHAGCQME
ncbi:PREDICTED: E3 ubiquitin-protein ligase RNF144A-like [Nelumbo nucifera]|uniref:RBR-type E3 ubiquitin transferase n=1 Tax=Nelumbo nucifera TaxID=4432 RepID=A0A1U8A7U9_NELNU|nr:PREDICTED: E3 ubiquitin-protein ligase RNF144A-like [Nelumbo nucifera]